MNIACRFKVKTLATALGALFLASALFSLWIPSQIRSTDGSPTIATPARPTATAPEPLEMVEDNTDPAAPKSESESAGELRQPAAAAAGTEFDVPAIYDALQQIGQDEQGNIIPDHRALTALNEVLGHGRVRLAERDLEELQALIRIALPGAAGNQAAELTGRYSHFLQAEKEFTELHRGTGFEQPAQPIYDQLVALRQLYLGDDLTASLFAKVDRDSRYMLKSMALGQDQSLAPDERRRQQERLSRQHHNTVPDIPDWEQRLATFESEKQLIMQTLIPEEEKQQQMDALLERHFNAHEIPKVKNFLESR